MNLITALKQSRPIRRRAWQTSDRPHWFDPETMLRILERGDLRPWSREDLLADDWEIQEPTVTITRSQFWAAVGSYAGCLPYLEISGRRYNPAEYVPDVAAIARKLGLE